MKKNLLQLLLLTALVCCGSNIFAHGAAYPPSHSYFADINGAHIYYSVTGRGEPLVLIHGYPLNGDLFQQQRRFLSIGFRVITLDLRGFGRSTAPDDVATIDTYVDDVLGLLDLLNIQQAIIGGHSMGGAITLRLYQRAPNRFRAMILNDAAAFPPPTVEQFTWRGYQQQSREGGAESLLPLLLPEFLTGFTRDTRPELVTEVSNLVRAASLNGLVGGSRALETRSDLRPVFPTISVPTLILYGEEDSLTPVEQARMLRAAIPNSELAIIRGASHGVIREESALSNFVIASWAIRNLGLRGDIAVPVPDGATERIITSNEEK